ncbi:MAG TPA: inorganic diphosphatase [Bryobacteraceae bacterium]|nr:inorganic diphosphatase [Bryobacteraceae bacterium]
MSQYKPLSKIATTNKHGDWNVIIETPKGNRNKLAYDEDIGVFQLKGVLPSGAVFPFDFGFLPSTEGGDGDPLDVLLLMDEPTYPGTLVPSRLLGVIEANQTEDGKTERNDRLIAVAANSRRHGGLQSIQDLNALLLEEIEHFFTSYNLIKGKRFAVVGRSGPERAQEVIAKAQEKSRP